MRKSRGDKRIHIKKSRYTKLLHSLIKIWTHWTRDTILEDYERRSSNQKRIKEKKNH